MSHLATAALVLLVLAGSMFALGSQRSLNTGWAPMLPALSSTPTADSEVVTETLISTSFDSLPNGPATIAAYFVDLQPGVSASMGNQVGTMAYYVDRGTVRVVHDDLEQVLHAGERWSAPVRDFSSFENVGDEDATIVEVDVLDTIASSSADAYTEGVFSDPIGGSSSFVIEAATDLPGGPGEVTLQRLTVPPGGTLAPYIQTELDWIGIAEGRVGVTLVGEQRLPFRWDSGEERTYGVSPSLPVIAPGTEITLRNAEDTPLVIYHLTIEPSEATGSPDGSPVP
jgi:hypothetical protein